jgi:tetratricopeptide (TPR) repeat protein
MKKPTFVSIMSAVAFVCALAMPSFSEGSVEELMASGNALLKNGAYTEAIGTFKKVLGMEPRNFEAQYNLAFAYLQAERYDKAVMEFKKAIGLEPRNAECWANIGFVYERLGKNSMAAEAIAHSVELNPNNLEARMNLAGMYENANAFDKAIAQYEAAIRTDGSRGDAYCGVARCMTEKGNIAGAKKYLSEATTRDANNAEAHWLLGNILWKKESKHADALKEYQISVRLDQNSQVFYENLGKLQEEMGKKDDAIATWKKFLIYLNEASKKEEVQARIDKLERGENPSAAAAAPAKADGKAARMQAAEDNTAHMEELQKELRKDKPSDTKHMETEHVDVGSDMDKISKDTSSTLDLRKEAKKKAEAKKEGQ